MAYVITSPSALFAAFFYFLPLEVLLDFGPDAIASLAYRHFGLELAMSVEGPRKRRFVRYYKAVFPRSFEEGLEAVVTTGLYYPLFEELVFRGLPYLIGLGVIGVALGTAVWVLMHPVWRLKMLPVASPTSDKLKMFAIDIADYSVSGAWLSWLWLSGWGILAIAYHIFHNVVVIMPDVAPEGVSWLKERLRLPWGKGGGSSAPERGSATTFVSKARSVAPATWRDPSVCIARSVTLRDIRQGASRKHWVVGPECND